MPDTPQPPLPQPTEHTQPFWTACANAKSASNTRPRPTNGSSTRARTPPPTLADDLEWRDIPGAGTLYTYTIARRPTAAEFAGQAPQIIAVVELDEGPRLTSTLVNVDERDIRVGMRLQPVFDDVDEHTTLLRYEPLTE